MRVTAIVTWDGRIFVARCVEADVASQGATFEEALANLRGALMLHFGGDPAASPGPAVVALDLPFSAP